jgi:hypothetical protein
VSDPAAPGDGGLGCSACWGGPYRVGEHTEPHQIAMNPTAWFLYRCRVCGTYWHADDRSARPVTEATARSLFPEEFAS